MRLQRFAPLILVALLATPAEAGLFGMFTRSSQLVSHDGIIGFHDGGASLGLVAIDDSCVSYKLSAKMADKPWPVGKPVTVRLSDGVVVKRDLHGRRVKRLVNNPCAARSALEGVNEDAIIAELCAELDGECGVSKLGFFGRTAIWAAGRIRSSIQQYKADQAELAMLRPTVDKLRADLRSCQAKKSPPTGASASSVSTGFPARVPGYEWGCGRLSLCFESIKDGHHGGCDTSTYEALCEGAAR